MRKTNTDAPVIDSTLYRKTLVDAGLNLHAVFNLEDLPEKILSDLRSLYPDLDSYQQLILFAHGGRQLWQKVKDTLNDHDNPIDSYSSNMSSQFCEQSEHISAYKLIYPSADPVGLQSLGELAGWHHGSPFRVGINQQWGSWFAYRAAVLTASNFSPTEKVEVALPCDYCKEKPCISACPAKALESNFSLQKCLDYRKADSSSCKDRCLSRMACPIAIEHQYELEQIQYHYGISMKMIKALNL